MNHSAWGRPAAWTALLTAAALLAAAPTPAPAQKKAPAPKNQQQAKPPQGPQQGKGGMNAGLMNAIQDVVGLMGQAAQQGNQQEFNALERALKDLLAALKDEMHHKKKKHHHHHHKHHKGGAFGAGLAQAGNGGAPGTGGN